MTTDNDGRDYSFAEAAAAAGTVAVPSVNNDDNNNEDDDVISSSSSTMTPITSNTGGSSGGGLFFADATLDLSEAHDFVETPEPQRGTVGRQQTTATVVVVGRGDSKHNPSQTTSGAAVATLEMPSLTMSNDEDEDKRRQETSPSTTTTRISSPKKTIISTTPTSSSRGSNGDINNNTMNRITSDDVVFFQSPSQVPQLTTVRRQLEMERRRHGRRRRHRTQRPRDLSWAVAFIVLVPTCLILASLGSSNNNNNNTLDDNNNDTSTTTTTSTSFPWAAQWSIFVSIILAYGVAMFVLVKILYPTTTTGGSIRNYVTMVCGCGNTGPWGVLGGGRTNTTSGGGSSMASTDHDGRRQDAAHVLVTMGSPMTAIVTYSILTLVMVTTIRTTTKWYYVMIPVVLVLSAVVQLPQWRTQQLFLRALVCMDLDILHRSLKHKSFSRTLSLVLGLQVCAVVWWKVAILNCIVTTTSSSSSWSVVVWLFLSLFAGKWMTSTITSILSYVSSGGIAHWCWQQSLLLQEHYYRQQQQQEERDDENHEQQQQQVTPTTKATLGASDELTNTGTDDVVGFETTTTTSMPEEYRTVDASIYQSVLNVDDYDDDVDMEDNDDDDDGGGGYVVDPDDVVDTNAPFSRSRQLRQSRDAQQDASLWNSSVPSSLPSCRTLVIAAVTTSFGSVAQCGLLGGLAQILWSCVRHADGILQHHAGFRGMTIGGGGGEQQYYGDGDHARGVVWKLCTRANVMARNFVRTHTDLAMCHVAAYSKSYQKAAADVMMLVDASGVEPIIHDDMTTHVCSNVCGSISGIIVLVVGTILSHKRPDGMTDDALVQSMLLAFLFCYTLLFTAMEPLRASIKAIYVCFAEHPESLSQSFPLIFHRLSRISEANLA